MFRTLIISGSLLVLVLGGLFFHYETVTPCGVLRHEMYAEWWKQTVRGGRAYPLIGRTWPHPIYGHVDTYTSWRCLKELGRRALVPTPEVREWPGVGWPVGGSWPVER